MRLYDHIGVAAAVTPRLVPLLSEARRWSERFGSDVSLIHVGNESPDTARTLRSRAEECGISPLVPILWGSGSPAQAIIDQALQANIRLVLAGALERERGLRHYLGSVARTLVRESPTSLLLLVDPQREPRPLRRIVVMTDFSEAAVIGYRKALELARREEAECVRVVRVHSTYGEAMALARGVGREEAANFQQRTAQEERQLLQDFIDGVGTHPVPVQPVYIEGHPGVEVAAYVRSIKADLLVVPSLEREHYFLERIFPTDMEWLLREIPSNLWIVRHGSA